ncbi:MAG: PHP domain-containing protein, partial [Polyangiaceae bacterium]
MSDSQRRERPADFVELLGRSAFSFLEASSMPEELVEAAHGLGLGAIALCDRDGIYGLPRAYAQGKKLGMPVIIGAEVTLDRCWPAGVVAPRRDAPGDPPVTLALLAEDHTGYGNLCKHLTTAHADHEKGEAGITLGEIAASAAGLSALLPLGDALVMATESAADLDARVGPVREAFGARAALCTWRRFDGLDRRREAVAHAAAQRFGLPVVASARPRFHHPSRKPLADVMYCIKHKTTLDAAGTILAANAEACLRTPTQMRALFRDRPEWVRASLDVADRCRFSLGQLQYAFPSDTLCLPGESA